MRAACLHAQVRSSYAADLQHRTELENLLRGAVEEVVQEVRAGRRTSNDVSNPFLPWSPRVRVPMNLALFRSTREGRVLGRKTWGLFRNPLAHKGGGYAEIMFRAEPGSGGGTISPDHVTAVGAGYEKRNSVHEPFSRCTSAAYPETSSRTISYSCQGALEEKRGHVRPCRNNRRKLQSRKPESAAPVQIRIAKDRSLPTSPTPIGVPPPVYVSRPARYGKSERERPSWVCPIRTSLVVLAVAEELPLLGCRRGRSLPARETRPWRCSCRESACFLCSMPRFAVVFSTFSTFAVLPLTHLCLLRVRTRASSSL